MRIEGAPRYHISTLLQTPPAFLVLSSHAYSALGRFLIFSKVTTYTFAFLLFSAFFAVLLSLALLAWFFQPKSLMISDWKWIYKFFVPPCGFKLKRLLQLKFIGWKRVHRIFQTSVWYPAFPLSQSETSLFFPIAKYAWKCHMLVSSTYQLPYGAVNVSTIRSSVSRCFFLRVLGYVIARNIKARYSFFGK